MFFIPAAILGFIGLILLLPALFFLGFFHIITVGFANLGISAEITILLFLAILVCSLINIPLGKTKIFQVEETRFFGLLKNKKLEAQGIAINVGGAVIPVLISFYFLFLAWRMGYDLNRIFLATLLMIIVSKILAKTVPGQGVRLPIFIPPVCSVIFSFILAPGFVAPCAFISGVLGTIIGADLLNLNKIKKHGGYLSIGGAGVFDGVFLVGIISALLSGL